MKWERKYWKDSEWREKNGDWDSEDVNGVHKPLAV